MPPAAHAQGSSAEPKPRPADYGVQFTDASSPMPLMQARRTFKIDRNRFVAPGDIYDCTEGVAGSHEAMGYAVRASRAMPPVPVLEHGEAKELAA